ncbi:beta strand repeat-containing protein [Maribacter sp. LLG6340-A2]|uniref:beta strand repeat-containing protein n=1 Tax=Maribacter sp. LLG6340-A2 TaxID=3160834 RepID=UPI00386F7B75
MKAIIFFFLILLFTIPSVTGQIKIGDNPQNIDPASVLELESSSKVLVITRVTTAEMDAILPQRGGIVYNTDAECIFYFDGASWINLCDAIDFTITNEPIVNNRSTIAITQSNEGYNLEVAKNSILGNNIVDGGIGAVDIADNSITQDKLAENSVGSSELRENSVGSIELRERSIQAVNIAEHTPGHILITDENGIVVWQEADALKGAIADEFTITGDGTLENRLELSEGIQLNISNNTTLIADHIVADEDTDDTNELVDLSFDKLTNTLSISKSATPNGGSVNLEAVIGSDDQELTLNNNILTLEAGGAPIDLTTYLDNTDEQTLSINGNILSITGGNDITLPVGAAEVDGDVRNELQDLAFDNATSILTLTNPGTPGNQVNLSGLAGGGITSLNNGFILLGNGDDEPTEVSIDGDATMNNIGELTIKDGVITPANIEPLTPTPTANQMLITNTDGVVTWAPAGSGTSTLPNGNIFIGNDLNTAIPTVVQGDASLSNNGTLTLLNKVVEGANIADETIVLENLNQNGATNGQIIKWNQALNAGAGAWTVANDLTDGTGIPTLANGNMLIGNDTNLPTEVTISGDATIADTGILTIADDAITLDKLSNMGADDGEVLKWNQDNDTWELGTDIGTAFTAGNGLALDDQNDLSVTVDDTTIEINNDILRIKDDAVTLDKLSDMGATANGQLLKWDQDNNTWELGTDIGTAFTAGNGLALDAQNDLSVTVDDTTIEINNDILRIKDDAVTLDKLNPMGADTNGQLLKWNQDNTTWELGTDIGTAYTAAEGLALDAQNNLSVRVDDTTIEIENDILQIKPSTINNQFLRTIGGTTVWQNLTNPLNIGSILFSDGDGGVTENNDQLFWDNSNSKLYLGTQIVTTNDVKLNVGGTTRTQGLKNSSGSAGSPSYRFTNNGDTGMYLIDEDGILGFTANNKEAIRIDDLQNVGIGPTFEENGTPIAARLHVDGDIRTEGAITASGAITGGIPDYVFQKYFLGNSILNPNYEFKDLLEIEKFVKQYNHLPGIQSASAIKEQGFWDLGEASRINLEKIEELFLHTIEQEKKIKALEASNKNMATELQILKQQMEEIKNLMLAQKKE